MDYRMYDIVIVNKRNEGHVQNGRRPYVLIQNNIGNKYSDTTIGIPITTHLKRREQPTHYIISPSKNNNLKKLSMIMAEQVTTINCNDIIKKIGHIEKEEDKENIIKCYISNVVIRT